MTVGAIPTEKGRKKIRRKMPFCIEVCNYIYIYIYIYLCLCAVCRLSLCTSLQGLQELLLKGDMFEQVFFFFPFFAFFFLWIWAQSQLGYTSHKNYMSLLWCARNTKKTVIANKFVVCISLSLSLSLSLSQKRAFFFLLSSLAVCLLCLQVCILSFARMGFWCFFVLY